MVGGNGDEPTVEGTVKRRRQGNTIAYSIVMAFGKGHDVAGIDHLNVGGGNDAHARYGTAVVIDLGHFALEEAAAQEYLLIVIGSQQMGNLGAVGGRAFVEDLVGDVGEHVQLPIGRRAAR